MDDATSEVYSAFLVEEESTHSSFRGLQETIEAKGLFCSFDRGKRDAEGRRQGRIGRAPSQLGRTSPPIRHRPGGGSSGSSARSRTVCRKSSDWPGSAPSRRPTASARSSCRCPIRRAGSRSRLRLRRLPRAQAHRHPVRPGSPSGPERQHRALSRAAPCRSPNSPTAGTSSRPASASMEYPDGTLAVFHGPRCFLTLRSAGQP